MLLHPMVCHQNTVIIVSGLHSVILAWCTILTLTEQEIMQLDTGNASNLSLHLAKCGRLPGARGGLRLQRGAHAAVPAPVLGAHVREAPRDRRRQRPRQRRQRGRQVGLLDHRAPVRDPQPQQSLCDAADHALRLSTRMPSTALTFLPSLPNL